jgi:hypothetical protein
VLNRAERIGWCCEEIRSLLRREILCYEDEFYSRLCWIKGSRHQEAGARYPEWWRVLPVGDRGNIISKAIEALLRDRLIEMIPGRTQATGRRAFQEKNPLDAIVDALDEAEHA